MTVAHETRRGAVQLKRLTVLTDVVFGLLLFRTFQIIPQPPRTDWSPGFYVNFFVEHASQFTLVAIGLAVTIIYWIQNNSLSEDLGRTDGRHTALSIFQLFSLLLFVWTLRLEVEVGGSVGTRALQSIAVALAGFTAAGGWAYAKRGRRLLPASVSDEDARAKLARILAEPITAVMTIPFAFLGAWYWEAAWLLYLVNIRLLKRRFVGRESM